MPCALRRVIALLVGCLLIGFASPALAQRAPAKTTTTQGQQSTKGTTTSATGQSTTSPTTPPPSMAVTFDVLFSAVEQQDYTAVQVRRFFGDQGQMVSVREEVKVDANGSEAPPFAISFLGVLGELPGSVVHQKWQQTYSRFGRLFHEQGSFRVRHLGKSTLNYSLYAFGTAVRAGRSAHRVVVFPHVLDKSIWVIDVDATTFVPLYSAEFDSHFRLLSEVEVETLVETAQLPAGMQGPSGSAQHADFAAAKAALGNPTGLIEPNASFTGEYQVDKIETRIDPLNGQQKLVLAYTDGVDQFFIVQTVDASDVFAGLFPGTNGQPPVQGNTIARYRDPGMSVLLFWEGNVAFHVAGRGSLERLDEFARRLYLQALSTN
jgi:hypothetical protein